MSLTTDLDDDNGTTRLREAGVSIWLDDLSRDDIVSGRLQELMATRGVTGITTNPTIFAKAVTEGRDAYAGQLRELKRTEVGPEDAALAIVTDDVRAACDILLPVHIGSRGADGFVSIEVTPDVAHDTHATVAQASRLRDAVDRPNVLVKIPSTTAGVKALEQATAEGLSINMTLLFGLDRYREVIAAYRSGLERARDEGIDLTGIHSVASFFVSRVDVETDRRLTAIGGTEAEALRGQAAVANARLAYAEYETSLNDPRWLELAAAGANAQRPLWASTGVKDPRMLDTRYIDDLVAPDVVDTMPVKTLEAVWDHGRGGGDSIHPGLDDARAIVGRLLRIGVDLHDVANELERAGVHAFGESWKALVAALS
jgi:transaldolase